MIRSVLTNEIVKYITEIEKNRYQVSSVKLSRSVANKLRKNSKKKSSYASNKIEGNPLSEQQVDEVIERDEHKHFLKPEQEVRNYFLALEYLEDKAKSKEKLSKKLILAVQKLVEKGASKEKIGLRGPMPPGVLFAVYDSQTGNPEYIPPEYSDIPGLLDELIEYVNTTDDHPLLVAAIVHYQLVTIHPFEDGNGRMARTITDMLMTRADELPHRFYSISAEILERRSQYYDVLEMTQNGNMDITDWIMWFLDTVAASIEKADTKVQAAIEKAKFWDEKGNVEMNDRQRKLINRLLDGFFGKLTSGKWAKIAKCSPDTALRDINDLIKKGVLKKTDAGGRSASYELT